MKKTEKGAYERAQSESKTASSLLIMLSIPVALLVFIPAAQKTANGIIANWAFESVVAFITLWAALVAALIAASAIRIAVLQMEQAQEDRNQAEARRESDRVLLAKAIAAELKQELQRGPMFRLRS